MEPERCICPQKAEIEGFCLHHHPHQWESSPDEVRKEFYKDVRNQVKAMDLVCVGYNLPDIGTHEISDIRPICFQLCNLVSGPDIPDSTVMTCEECPLRKL